MIVLRTPKGWTGPKEVDGLPVEGTWRAHQVPMADVRTNPEHLALLEEWMRSYRPEELFDDDGRLLPELAALAPRESAHERQPACQRRRAAARPRHARLPRPTPVEVAAPGQRSARRRACWGVPARRHGANPGNFRLFGPDETDSNRLDAVFEATDQRVDGPSACRSTTTSPDGRVMEVLCEHTCARAGWRATC